MQVKAAATSTHPFNNFRDIPSAGGDSICLPGMLVNPPVKRLCVNAQQLDDLRSAPPPIR
jgi:hypothetical protein